MLVVWRLVSQPPHNQHISQFWIQYYIVTTIFLIRHAENLANLTKEFSNRRVDYSLTPKGILQAQQTGAYLSGRGVTHLFSSPLKRARETAEIIGARIGLPVMVSELLREVDVGDLEGQPPTQELWEQHSAVVRAWRAGQPELRFPGGENYLELVARAQAGLAEILAACAGPQPARIAMVIHGGWLSQTRFALFPGLDPQAVAGKDLANCSITELELDAVDGQRQARLVMYASYAHLSGQAADLVPGSPRTGELKSKGESA